MEEPRRTILVDSIMDWRDPDDLHRINGAESDYYQSLPTSYSAKNGPFDTVEDLLWVRGVTTALFYGSGESGAAPESGAIVGLKQLFTVDSPNDRVNLRTASAEVSTSHGCTLGEVPQLCRRTEKTIRQEPAGLARFARWRNGRP
jgi:general secretion pathway protein K